MWANMFFLSFSVVWNVSCPRGEGFVGSRQPSRAQGWDRGGQGTALQASHDASCVTQCLFLKTVWFYYWGKLCKWCQNVKCMYACRHELTKSLGVGHGSWSFEKRGKPGETDSSHTDTRAWVRTVNLKKKVSSNTKWKVTNVFVCNHGGIAFYGFFPKKSNIYKDVFRRETFVHKHAHNKVPPSCRRTLQPRERAH